MCAEGGTGPPNPAVAVRIAGGSEAEPTRTVPPSVGEDHRSRRSRRYDGYRASHPPSTANTWP